MNRYWIKMLNLVLVVGILFAYNTTLEHRTQAEEIARLTAELASSNLQLAKYAEKTDNRESQEQPVESDYVDGVYQASARGYGGDITMELMIEQGMMTRLNILSAAEEDGAYLQMASSMVKEILRQQSVEVDTVSGATYSSIGIRDATAKALEQAKK
ncbi:MAG: FMN-binding protein [Lachnospiraceae bacterium]|nr:FMN-binding protein [Lachnospiraceae bacterium]